MVFCNKSVMYARNTSGHYHSLYKLSAKLIYYTDLKYLCQSELVSFIA